MSEVLAVAPFVARAAGAVLPPFVLSVGFTNVLLG